MLRMNDEEYEAVQERLEQFPRTGSRGMRKVGATLALRTSYLGEAKAKTPNLSWWGVEVFYLDTKYGARWLKAKRNTHVHRTGVAWVNAYLKMWKLQQLVDSSA